MRDLKNGVYDLLVGPISLSDNHFKDVDFTQPWFLSNIKLVKEKYNNENEIIIGLVKSIVLLIIFAFFLLLFNGIFIKKMEDNRLSIIKLFSQNIIRLISGRIKSIKLSSNSKFLPIFNTVSITIMLFYLLSRFAKFFTGTDTDFEKTAINGKNVIVEFDSNSLELARKHSAVPKQIYVDPKKLKYNKNVKLDTYLDNKQDYYGVLDTEPTIKYYMNSGNPNYARLNINDKTLGIETLAFPIRKYSPFLDRLNKQLIENKDNRIHEIIIAKYVGSDIAKNANF
jgi:ABC-type amino acid transport substrate-binding protein